MTLSERQTRVILADHGELAQEVKAWSRLQLGATERRGRLTVVEEASPVFREILRRYPYFLRY